MEMLTYYNGEWLPLESLGARLVGDVNSLLQWPALKKPYQTSWAESDGIEVYLDEVYLDAATASISVAYADDYETLTPNLHSVLMGQRYTLISLPDVGVIVPVRYTGETSLDSYGTATAKLNFALDFPMSTGWTIDGVSNPFDKSVDFYRFAVRSYHLGFVDNDIVLPGFANIGITPLDGCWDELDCKGSVKSPYLVKSATRHGALAIAGEIHTDGREISLPLLMQAEDALQLFHNYQLLLYRLTTNGPKKLYKFTTYYPCYYVKQALNDVYLDNGAQLTMTLTIKLI